MNNPKLWPRVTSSIQIDPKVEAKIDQLMSEMSLEQKIGQTIQAEIKSITPAQAKAFHIGSILNAGGSIAGKTSQFAAVDEWITLADQFYDASTQTTSGEVIPLMWATDSMHGANNVLGATIFPHNIGLGATQDPELMNRIGHATAIETLVSGVDWIFAPTLAVVRDDRWGRTYEAYSEDPQLITDFAAPMVTGIQGDITEGTLFNEDRILANAKHFIGDGGTAGVDQGNTAVTEEELVNIHAQGYFKAIEAGVQVIMASFNSWNGDKLHGHDYLLTDVLKDQMGFDGFVVGDWNGHGQVPNCTNASSPESFNAGVDLLMVPEDWEAMFHNMKQQVTDGIITQARLDDAVRRILRVKLRMGLFEQPTPSARKYSNNTDFLANEAHTKLAEESVRKSLVLLKNNEQTLPLNPAQNILVLGEAADDIGMQCGGWTLTWQGETNVNKYFPHGRSILDGISEHVKQAGGKVNFAANVTDDVLTNKPDVAVIVFGETPYAEMQGDLDHLAFQHGSNKIINQLKMLQAHNIPVVSVFISGRPLWLNKEINASDAFVAAWLPGTAGNAIADILLASSDNTPQYDFSGKLSFSWPKQADQFELNIQDENYDPLFPVGFGLNYSSQTTTEQFDETVSLGQTGDKQEIKLFAGRAIEPWNIIIKSGSDTASINSLLPQTLSGINSQTIDQFIQGDARKVSWLGESQTSLEITLPANDSYNLESVIDANAARLSLDVNVADVSSETIYLEMIDAMHNSVKLNITEHLNAVKGQGWTCISIPLVEFKQANTAFDFTAVQTILKLAQTTAWQFSFSTIKLEN